MRPPLVVSVAGVAIAMTISGAPAAQPTSLHRTLLQTMDVPDSLYQAVIGTSEIGPNKSGGRQTHPGPEGGYVLRGSGTILLEGKPPMHLKAGQSYQLAPGAVHEVRSGPHGVKLVVTWVVEKGKPFVSPAH